MTVSLERSFTTHDTPQNRNKVRNNLFYNAQILEDIDLVKTAGQAKFEAEANDTKQQPVLRSLRSGGMP